MTVEVNVGSHGRRLTLGERLGSGAEGWVFGVVERDSLAIKLSPRPSGPPGEPKEAAQARYQRRIEAMVAAVDFRTLAPAGHVAAAWPIGAARSQGVSPVPGFAMARLSPPRYRSLSALIEPARRASAFPGHTMRWDHLVNAALNLARLFCYVEARGWMIVDPDPRNFLVTMTGLVSAIDTDSWQWTDPRSGERFPCWVPTHDYGGPEVAAAPRGTVFEPPAQWFGLSVLVCQLLLAGDHPFDGVPQGLGSEASHTLADAIGAGRSRLVDPAAMAVPPWSTPVDVMTPEAIALARRCFGPGRTDSLVRPTPSEWVPVLTEILAGSVSCTRSAGHRFLRSRTTCPWCELTDRGFADPFPVHDGAAARPGPVAPPRRAPSQAPATPMPAPARAAPAPTRSSAPSLATVLMIVLVVMMALTVLARLR